MAALKAEDAAPRPTLRRARVDGAIQETLWSRSTTRGFDASPGGGSFPALTQGPQPPAPLVTRINVIRDRMDKVKAKLARK